MFIELSEALACPDCGPPQGLVVVVEGLDGRRVLDGFLGCPICEGRFPIREGVVELGGESGSHPVSQAEIASEQLAEMIAALFDVRDGRGYILLDEALEPVAERVAALTGGCETIALADTILPDVPAPGTNRVSGAGPTLPVQTGRLRALALGGPTEARLSDAIRALGPDGRLVVVSPSVKIREALANLPVQPLADESIAFLGVVSATG